MPNSANRGMPARILRTAFTLTLGAVVTGAAAAPAAAETALQASSPGDGTRVGAVPDKVVLDFSEPLRAEGARVTVQGPDGRDYQSGDAQVTANRVRQPLRPLGESGRYNAVYRVVDSGGRRVTGVIAFTLSRSKSSVSKPIRTGRPKKPRNPASPATTVDLNAGRDDVPPWIFILGVGGAAVIVAGAAWFGRRLTDDLD